MKVHSLFSSSSGNCMKIFTDKATIIIDAGVSYKRVCEANGEPLHDLNALFITHDHGDHVGGAGVMGRKTGAPIYIHEKSYKAREKLFKDCETLSYKSSPIVELVLNEPAKDSEESLQINLRIL